jgi:general stress protein 26
MLTDEIRTLIENHSAGMVATVNADGTPSVSPKATFLILADDQLAFSNIRSPHTIENLKDRPAIEVCFIDVVLRKSVRITGSAKYVEKSEAELELIGKFEEIFEDYLDSMSGFVLIHVYGAEWILSPAYDLGSTEEQLRESNMSKLNNIYPDQLL